MISVYCDLTYYSSNVWALNDSAYNSDSFRQFVVKFSDLAPIGAYFDAIN